MKKMTKIFKDSRKIQQADVFQHQNLYRDYNLLHCDKNFTKRTRFEKPILQGAFLFSLVPRYFQNFINKEEVVYLTEVLSLRFLKPIYYPIEEITFQFEEISEIFKNSICEKRVLVSIYIELKLVADMIITARIEKLISNDDIPAHFGEMGEMIGDKNCSCCVEVLERTHKKCEDCEYYIVDKTEAYKICQITQAYKFSSDWACKEFKDKKHGDK